MRRCRPIPLAAPELIFLISLSGCSDAPLWAGSVEIRDGIEVISNPGDPLLGDSQGVVSELWKVRGPDWVDPSRVHVLSGLITLVDPPANQVQLFSTSGEMKGSLGNTGGGPGEFLSLLDAFPDGEKVVAIDAGKGSVEYLDFDGDHLFSLHLDGQPWDGFPLGDGALLVKGEFLSDPTVETLGDWVTVREGSEPRAFTTQPLNPLPEEQGVQCSDFSAWPEGAARLRFTTPQIQVFDRSGKLRMESWIDLKVGVISGFERDSALSELRRTQVARGLPPEFIEQSLVVMEERWRVKCRFRLLRFDPSGQAAAFLEQNPDEFGAGNATLHFLTRNGVYLAKVAFPTAWRDFAMENGVIYSLTRDPSTDLVTLRAYRVDLPASLFRDATAVLEEARQRLRQRR